MKATQSRVHGSTHGSRVNRASSAAAQPLMLKRSDFMLLSATFKCQHSVVVASAARARCQTNFAGSMVPSGSPCLYGSMVASRSPCLYSAPTVNGAQKAAPNEPLCYRNIVAETLVLKGVCVRVRVFPR